MLVFVDESGDPGLKLDGGSTAYFIVTIVVFEDHDEAQAADQRITLLRRELDLSEKFEFHFSKCHQELRERFLAAVVPYDFLYLGIVINKALLYGPGFQYRESFYKYVCGLVFENAKPYLDEAIVIFDGSGSKDFRRQLERYLKRRINTTGSARRIRKVKIQESRRNNLIQLADMICGALARSFKPEKADSKLYRKIISLRELHVQVWPA